MNHNKIPSEKLFEKVFFEKRGVYFKERPNRYKLITIFSNLLMPLSLFIFLPLHLILLLFKIKIIFNSTGGLGDDLVSTSFISIISNLNKCKFIVITRHPLIYKNNPDVFMIFDCNKFIKGVYSLLIILFESNIYPTIINFRIKTRGFVSNNKFMRSTQSTDHLMLGHLNKYYYDICKKLKPFKNRVYLTDYEIKIYSKKYSYLPKSFILVLSECLTNPIKDWGFENVQKLVNNLSDFNFVQVGTSEERSLKNVVNLNGKTNLRELFYLVSIAKGIFCHEGFLTHLSSCFEIPCFTIFSGYHPNEVSKYSNVIPIIYNKKIGCKYCWYLECPLKDHICIKGISVKYVSKIIFEYYNKVDL